MIIYCHLPLSVFVIARDSREVEGRKRFLSLFAAFDTPREKIEIGSHSRFQKREREREKVDKF